MKAQFFRVPHPRFGIVALGKAESREQALEMLRRDDPCWNEIEAERIAFGGDCTDNFPIFVAFRAKETMKAKSFPSNAMRRSSYVP